MHRLAALALVLTALAGRRKPPGGGGPREPRMLVPARPPVAPGLATAGEPSKPVPGPVTVRRVHVRAPAKPRPPAPAVLPRVALRPRPRLLRGLRRVRGLGLFNVSALRALGYKKAREELRRQEELYLQLKRRGVNVVASVTGDPTGTRRCLRLVNARTGEVLYERCL